MAQAARDQNFVTTLLGVDSATFLIPTTVAVNAASHAMLVEASFTPSGTQDVNLIKVGGTTFSLGQQLAAASLPVVLTAAQISTLTPLSTVAVTQFTSPWVVSLTSTTITGSVAVTGSATGSAVPAGAFYMGISDAGTLRGLLQAANSLNSTGTGVPTSQIVAQFDDTSPSSVTENQFANVRMNSARQLYAQPVKIDTFGAATTFTITLASLANSTAGVGRQSTLITSNTASSALIGFKFTTGTSPTANTLVYLYLIRGDGTLTDDAAGASDAGITIVNAPLLGTLLISTTGSNTTYTALFDTKFLGSLGPTFGVAVVNSSGATANGTGGNFAVEYTLIT